MSRQIGLWYKVVSLILALALMVPVLAACDDDEESTPSSVTSPSGDLTSATPAPGVSAESVKIGVIMDYTGPSAMAGFLADAVVGFTEWHCNEKQGGIDVGGIKRPVEFLKYDNQGQVAGAAAAAKKALLDGCAVLTMGGISGQFAYPIADVTDSEKVLFTTFLSNTQILNDYDFTVSTFINVDARLDMIAEFVVEKLQPQSVAILAHNLEVDRESSTIIKEKILARNPQIEIVYEQYYPLDIKDFAPFLTRIKYENPDVLLTYSTNDAYMSIAKQIMEIGGWGGIQHVASTEASGFPGVENSPGAQGWHIPLCYLQGYGTPAQIEFGELWAQKCQEDPGWCKKYSPSGSVPLQSHPLMYNSLLGAIKAIELAGSDDRAEVAEAALSGKLSSDTPLGYLNIDTNGMSDLTGAYVHVADGKLVPLE